MFVYANVDAEQRDEQFRERFIEGLSNPEFFEVILREDNRTFKETVHRAVNVEAIAESKCSRPNKRMDAMRVTQESATRNSNSEMNKMKQQLKGLTGAMNNLIEMMPQFISAVDPVQSVGVSESNKSVRFLACGVDGHIAKDCARRRNHLNSRERGTIAGVNTPGRTNRNPIATTSRGNCESCSREVS